MTFRFPHAASGLASGVLCALAATPAHGQETRTSAVTASVDNVGAVLAVSPLVSGARDPSGDLHVSGTVTTRQNGPYHLQVRLTTVLVGRGGGQSPDVHRVTVRLSDGSFTVLGATTWVTIASGPGSVSTVNAVAFLIQWTGGSKSPQVATTIPVEYRVISP